MASIGQFLREVRAEMGKVIWPSRREAIRLTLVVLAFSLAVAIFLGAIDLGLAELLKRAIE